MKGHSRRRARDKKRHKAKGQEKGHFLKDLRICNSKDPRY